MVLLHSKTLPLGSSAPDFKLKGIDGKWHVLEDYASAKVLVLIFMCNHCPYVQKIWSELVTLDKNFPSEVQMLGINSNGANTAYPEDSFEKMKHYAQEKGQSFPYLYDEDQSAAEAYQAACTPDIFVYGPDRCLAYHGAFEGLKTAVEALLEGQAPSKEQIHSMGCSIKWA
ncbi:thioredoxin family protein [Candidatus Peregrinibacteria bacterium]|nr:MAG: thioredoxin family protein [Candidatus Peregrinibacteria bacterium]